MDRRLVPALVGLALVSAACADRAPTEEATTTTAAAAVTTAAADGEAGGTDDTVSDDCENNLDLVNVDTVDEVELDEGAFGAALVIADGGPKSEDSSPEDGTVMVVITGTDMPESEYRAEWPAESPGAADGQNYLSFTLANPTEPVGPGQSFGTDGDDVAEVSEVAFYNGSTELTAADLTVEITEMTNEILCGEIFTNGSDGLGVAGPFKAERL